MLSYSPPRLKTANNAIRSFLSISKFQIIGIGKKTMAILARIFGIPLKVKNILRLTHLAGSDNVQSPDIGTHSAKTVIPPESNNIVFTI